MKRTEHRVHATLSNGQVLSVYFECYRNNEFDNDGYIYDAWHIGMRIGKKRRHNNDWWTSSKSNAICSTGHCGLEGMLKAKDIIMEFTKYARKDVIQKLVITGADERRVQAYRWMKRLGFEAYIIDGEDAYVREF